MNKTKVRRMLLAHLAASALAAGLLAIPSAAVAQEQGGAGTSGGYGRYGMMGGEGYGMGTGMMGGGYGMDAGMMGGGYGMGAGMMGGGYGMGAGMMGGGYGPGLAMMGVYGGYGMGPIWMLDLSDAQRSKVNAVADGLRKRHWAIMGQIMDDQAKLRDLYAATEPDPKAIGAVYSSISKLRQEMLEAHLQAMNQARSLLTPDQKAQLDRWRHEDWSTGAGSHKDH